MSTFSLSKFAQAAILTLGCASLALTGCNDDDNGTGGTSQEGSMILIIHDAPVDDFAEAWVTVESVTMIGANDNDESGEVVLTEPVRMDLLSLDSIALVVSAADIGAGSYSKIRLQISDPEFVRDDDSVFSGDDIQLVANGHVDINTQGDVFIVANEVTVVSLDVDLDNSVQINQTGNGRYILRPQIFVDNETSGEEGIIIDGAVITSMNLSTGVFTIETPGSQGDLDLNVRTTNQTAITSVVGLPLGLATLLVGSHVDIVGTIDVETGVVTASTIRVTS